MSQNHNLKKLKQISFGLIWLFVAIVFVPLAKADTLNQNQSFYVDAGYDLRGRSSVTASLRYVSGHTYGYVENEYWNSISRTMQNQITAQLEKVLTEFDNRIYPIEIQFFGAEPNPGIDGDSKITILFTPLIENAGGYFNNADVFKFSSENNQSNQREMFYVNISSISDADKMETFLAHEFQHLISLNQKEMLRGVSDDTWLNETRSEYAITLVGYNSNNFQNSSIHRRLQSFLVSPSDSLAEWKNLSADYGQVALFGEYLTENWTASIFTDALKSDAVGIPSINQALAKDGFQENFTDVFRDWAVANILNDSSVNSKFGYLNDNLKNFRVAPTKVINNLGDNLPSVVSVSIKDWQAYWYDISQFAPGKNDYLKISFVSPSLTSFQVGYIVFKTTGEKIVGYFEPDSKQNIIAFSDIDENVNRVILIPFKKDKLTGFNANEMSVDFSFTAERVGDATGAIIDPYLLPPSEKKPAIPNLFDLGLKEGDFIRAEGDNDVYIINNFGYKRLVLSPKICLQYGHLGARGCFGAMKVVPPSVRDAFKTSWYFTNGENHDGKVYYLKVTGEDTAELQHIKISGSDFVSQDGDFNSVFLFNALEQNSYSVGSALFKL